MTELGELGLSSYEEKAYRTLLVTGAVTATELSDISGVPKGRIYDVLNGLSARKLIRLQSTNPQQYVAEEPQTVVDRLLAERAYELTQEWDRYRRLAETVRSDLFPSPPSESSLWLGSLGSEEMALALQQHIGTAESDVYATLGKPYDDASWERLQPEFEAFFEGIAPDVSLSLILSEPVLTTLPETFPKLLEDEPIDVTVRTIPDPVLSFDVIDSLVTTIDIPHPLSSDDRLGTVGIKDSTVVNEFDRLFQSQWEIAEPLLN
ncbi:TrmB family transcriptional regulator [Natrinema pallidum]|uniref:Transcriptional regulator, TrmB n=1 Tax=Natrinema pallidum DSM 3751 TaxID=1227495 RepID=L9YWT1_9EURY|nr:helix-turn-helix domain-containing protein [Natrinema pallidum]ELY78569.1 transcriptional regulator, TrmB [Natrinema pallidum DSM 3751]